jgi:hypothetical protein
VHLALLVLVLELVLELVLAAREQVSAIWLAALATSVDSLAVLEKQEMLARVPMVEPMHSPASEPKLLVMARMQMVVVVKALPQDVQAKMVLLLETMPQMLLEQ